MQAAVRLRFRAGVIRLERLGAVNRGPTRTARELSASLNSATFDALAADLESIVYGGAPATEQQAAEAMSGWRQVTVEAARNLKAADSASASTASTGTSRCAHLIRCFKMNSARMRVEPGNTQADIPGPAGGQPTSHASSLVGLRARWRLLPAGWRVTVVIVAAVVLAGALIKLTSVLTEGSSPEGPESSSFSPTPDGLAAFSQLLMKSGDHVTQLTSPIAQAAVPPGSTVVVADPTSWQPADSSALDRVLDSGGRVVVAGEPPAGLLGEILGSGAPPQWSANGVTSSVPAGSGPLVFGVTQVDSTGPGSWSTAGGTTPLLASGANYLAVSARVGAGTLVLLASPSPLQNRLIGQADNAAFAIDVAGSVGRGSSSTSTTTGTGGPVAGSADSRAHGRRR